LFSRTIVKLRNGNTSPHCPHVSDFFAQEFT